MNIHDITLRLAVPDDADALHAYFRTLTSSARRHRFLGSIAELPIAEIRRCIGGDGPLFCVLAIDARPDGNRIIGEAVCAVAPAAEIALSVSDAMHRCGVARALLAALESHAIWRGAGELYGIVFDDNEPIKAVARSCGYVAERCTRDWTQRVLRKALRLGGAQPFVASASTDPWPQPSRRHAAQEARRA